MRGQLPGRTSPAPGGVLTEPESGSAPKDPGYRLPKSAPEPVNRAERDAFDALVADALPAVRASAQAWRNGLTALVTLVATGVIIQGQRTTADLPVPWRLAVTLLIGGGLATCILGLWHVLAAEAGTRTSTRTRSSIHERHGSVTAYQVALANAAGRRLHRARNTVAIALALLFAGVVTTWWAPASPKQPPAYLKVTHGTGTTCGTLQSADGGELHLTVSGATAPTVITFAAITNISVVAACS